MLLKQHTEPDNVAWRFRIVAGRAEECVLRAAVTAGQQAVGAATAELQDLQQQLDQVSGARGYLQDAVVAASTTAALSTRVKMERLAAEQVCCGPGRSALDQQVVVLTPV